MPLVRREVVELPSMRRVGYFQPVTLYDDDDDDDDEGPDGEQAICRPTLLSCGCGCGDGFPVINREGSLYCDEDEDYSLNCEEWESYSEPEEEEEKKAPRASPATFCGFKKSFLSKTTVLAPLTKDNQDCPLLSFVLPQKQQLTAEEAERNAEELVAEEERAKKKAEKKKLKKKRQKDRKRQEKLNQEIEAKAQAQTAESSDQKQEAISADVPNVLRTGPPEPEGGSSQGPSESLISSGCSTEEEQEEELDLTSTFVSKARLKVSTKATLHKEKPEKGKTEKGKTAQPQRTEEQEAPKPGLQKTPVEQSMVLADCGNETAKRGCYWEAVLLFTEAVKLNPQEYRFFGNRSFCYEKLQCYPEALRDAQVALRLQPGWPKGLFRQGKALMGLKQYAEAARTFEELLQIDGFRGDAATQLRRCQVYLMLQNSVASCAAPLPAWSGPTQGTRLPLPGGEAIPSCSPQGGMPQSAVTVTRLKCPPTLPSASAQAPVRELFAVWVGNLTPKTSKDTLLNCFQPFGPIDSIRCLPQKFCAFINYTRREAAEAAYAALQGVEVEGRKLQLQLKHPVHATPPVSKAPSSSSSTQQPPKREQAPLATALGFPQPNASRAKGDCASFGALRQRGATAKQL